ncbi:MAG: alpha/beta hydrolase [Actinomycetota bacterium]|nr:alpha/beta hydrolase [Actinomycetota bacterium]
MMALDMGAAHADLDPELRALLLAEPSVAADLPLSEAREAYERDARRLAGPPPPVARVEEREGAGVPVRVYVPEHPRPPRGAVVFLHGGGWAFGSLDSHDGLCRALAARAGAVVVAVAYRLAPEHPFPAAVQDAERTLAWVAGSGVADLGADGRRLAVAGDSAGGNLAAVLARRARDGGGPALALQALVYPALDTALDSPSSARFADGPGLTLAEMAALLDLYLPPGVDRTHPDVAPLRAADLAGVAPALVVLASHDPLRDEGEAYARRLREAGVPATVSVHPGTVHGFARWAGPLAAARRAQAEIGDALARALEAPG